MKKFYFFLLGLLSGLHLFSQGNPVPYTYNYTLTAASPTFNRPTDNGNSPPTSLSGLGTAVYYVTYSFIPTITGSYTFTESTFPGDGGDSFGVLYQSPFNPASPLTNTLIADDDDGPGLHYSITRTLTAGVSYTLVSTTFNNGITGSGSTLITGPVGAVLPVRWISVSGTLSNQDKATIKWQVQEENVDRYVIEKSTNGIDYTPCYTVLSKGNGIHNYEYNDNDQLTRQTFYRIVQYDINRDASYSSIVRLDVKQSSGVTIYPNPLKKSDLLQVSVSNRLLQTNARLVSANGVLLQTIRLSSQTFSVDLSKYTSGMYVLQFENGNSYKIIRE